MKIEILENFRHGREEFTAEETRVVDDALGVYFCNAGWAKDLSGAIATAPRDVTRVVTLEVDSAVHKTVAGDANG